MENISLDEIIKSGCLFVRVSAPVVDINLPEEIILPEGFPKCCKQHKGIYRHFIDKHETDEKIAQEILKAIVWFCQSYKEDIAKPDGVKACIELLHIFSYFPENICIYQMLIRIIQREDKVKGEYVEQNKIQLIEHLDKKVRRLKNTQLNILDRIEIYQKWLDCLPFELDEQAEKYASNNCRVTFGEKTPHPIYGEGIQFHEDAKFVEIIKHWSVTMLEYFSSKLAEDHPKKTYLNIKKKELEYKHRLTYQKIQQVGEYPEAFQKQVVIWLNDEKEFYSDWRELDAPKQKLVNSFAFQGDIKKLERLYTELLRYDLMSSKTSLSDFKNVLTKELEKNDSFIHWEAETIQVRYILDKMKPMFKQLRIVTIGDSKKMLSKQSNVITSNNLSNAKSAMRYTDVKDKDRIDTIFSSL